MKHPLSLVLVSLAAIALCLPGFALAHDRNLRTHLEGYQEVPAVSTVATGSFRARIGKDEQSIDYELSYEDLESDVRQAHIHLGQHSVNGGIVIFLCQTTFNPDPVGLAPTGAPTCPQAGTVVGTLTPAKMAPNAQAVGQGIAAGQFAELIRALRAGVAYANVHTLDRPGGEIRGQVE